jgi:protein ImuB
MRRIASIWLPGLAIERWARTADCAPDAPVILTVEGSHGPIIYAVTRAAAERGAQPGARVTDAKALDPTLMPMPADPEGDAALVQSLARWAGRWSPLVEVDDDGLRLDVTGVAHLFGGERGLVADIRKRFAAIGLSVRMAIAPTATASWALAHYGQKSATICTRDTGAKLADLPVAALRLPPEAVHVLQRLGLKTIGTLAGIERRALARRFREADNPVDALDRALGRKPEPLTAVPAERQPRALLKLEEPATHPEAAGQALERLIPELVLQLQQRHLGARRLSLTGYRVDGTTAVASVATSIPSREPKHLQRLFFDKAAELNPEFGFDAFALTADWAESLSSAQDSLIEEPGGERELARLVDRLTVKLGPKRVCKPQPQESHLPERASGWTAAVSSPALAGEVARAARRRGLLPPQDPSTSSAGPPPLGIEGRKMRPQRMLDRPEAIDVIYATPEGMPRRFVWRRAVHDITRAEGPERIAPEWWRQPSTARLRDYYRVEDVAGRRYWIYREGVIGDGRGGAPNWFIHGLFG